MACIAGKIVLQEDCHILVILEDDYNSCGLQWVAFLPPQLAIPCLKGGPQIWLGAKTAINSSDLLAHNGMYGSQKM